MNCSKRFTSFDDTKAVREALQTVQEYFDSWYNDDIQEYIRKEKERVQRARQQEASLFPANVVLETDSQIEKRILLRFITWPCYQDLSIVCNGVPQFIEYIFTSLDVDPKLTITFCPKYITQDHLERDFCILRHRAAGAGGNPTIYDVAFTLKAINKSRLAQLV